MHLETSLGNATKLSAPQCAALYLHFSFQIYSLIVFVWVYFILFFFAKFQWNKNQIIFCFSNHKKNS